MTMPAPVENMRVWCAKCLAFSRYNEIGPGLYRCAACGNRSSMFVPVKDPAPRKRKAAAE